MDGVVEVAGGRVKGHRSRGAWAFLGVPYAGSPAGIGRWRPPPPLEPWDGVRDAAQPGPVAPQLPPVPGAAIDGDPLDQDEDCLHLNVWTPQLDDRRRPVMVWIHGGGFTSGTAGSLLYAGSQMAEAGDVVVVAVNYRLGALGFLSHPALSTDAGHGNWGLLDQVAALRWVRDHVGAFGGDPDNVTVFGESAGAMSISALLTMPAARGLFHRAVLQSGPPYAHRPARAKAAAEDLAALVGERGVDRASLERVPAADLVAAVASLQARESGPGELPLPLLPAVDGRSLPVHPDDALASGALAPVPVLVGTNRDELSFFALSDPEMATMDEERLVHRLARSAPAAEPAEVIDTYRRARERRGEPTAPCDVWVAAGSDLVFRWPTLRLAALHRRVAATFVYLFTWETPLLGGAFGACHALEIPFVFGTVRDPKIAAFSGGGPAAEALSDQMQAAWVAFARAGDPSSPEVAWPRWDPDRRTTMVFGRESQVLAAPRDEELAVWEAAFPVPAPPPQPHPAVPAGYTQGASGAVDPVVDGGHREMEPGSARRPCEA